MYLMPAIAFTADTRLSPYVVLMLGHRLRRWPNIKPTLGHISVLIDTITLSGTHDLDFSEYYFHVSDGVSINASFLMSSTWCVVMVTICQNPRNGAFGEFFVWANVL